MMCDWRKPQATFGPLFLAAGMAGVCLAALVADRPAAAAEAGRRPNIVFVLADDLGYGDLGCYGQTKIKTPNLDRMAAQGLRFTDFYCGCAVCAPSRCTLMTGFHLGHATVRDNRQAAPGEEGQVPMDPGTVTVAQLLKAAGYATGIVGKWGLGMPRDHSSPLDFGFDHHYGYLCQGMAHTYYPPYVWRDNTQELFPGNPDYAYGRPGVIPQSGKTYSHDRMTDDALRWVRQQRGGPFFLYLAFTIPHLSLQVPEDSLAQYRGQWPETPMTTSKHYSNNDTPRAAYAAMITRMDRDIGRLLNLLQELGLDNDTLVFFASDNGAVFPLAGTDPEFFQSNGKLRGYKQDLYEGGIRTPFIARWPGRIAPGRVSNHPGAFYDLLPTLVELAGAQMPAATDGISIVPTLLDQGAQRRHAFLYWEYYGGLGQQAVRIDRWKGVRLNCGRDPQGPIELYDLAADEGEQHNLAGTHPEIVRQMAEVMAREHTPADRWQFRAPARPKAKPKP